MPMPKLESNQKYVNQIPSEAVIYAFSHCETWLEDYAKSHQLPAHELTGSVAGLLLAQTRGTVLGTFDYLSPLRRKTSGGNQTSRSVEMAGGPHRKASKRRTNSLKGRKYKPGTHWTQRPENKERLRKIAHARKRAA